MTQRSFEDTETLVRKWFADKGILEAATSRSQFLKFVEEVGELAAGMARGDSPTIWDSIGDILVTLIGVQFLLELEGHLTEATLGDILDTVYEEIAHRTGRMENGVFIKDDE